MPKVKALGMQWKRLMPDFLGLTVLTALAALTPILLPNSSIPREAWIFIYCGWIVFGEFIWHHQLAPTSPVKWLQYAAYSVVAAGLWLCLSIAGAYIFNINNKPGLSRLFDLTLLLILSPGFTFVAIAGFARAFLLSSCSEKTGKYTSPKR